MPVYFHILDAISRDQIKTITRETEEEQEYNLEYEEENDVDQEVPNSGAHVQERSLVIHLLGMTQEGESIRCDVTGFTPYLYVKVPPKTSESLFMAALTQKWDVNTKKPLLERVKRKELYGFTADEEFTFFKITVTTLKEFRKLKSILLNDKQEPIFRMSAKGQVLPVYESGLDPILRFFHLRNMQPCGWASVEPEEDSTDDITGIRVLTCDWNSIEPHSAALPSAPFKVLFWDLECLPPESGAFPVASAGDPIIQIGCVLKGSDQIIQRTIFVLGECEKDSVPGATVLAYTSEKAMLLGWFAWLIEQNPDILVGYNIFGFDEPYVWDRAAKLKITNDDSFQQLNRLSGHGGIITLQEKRLSSSAMGDNLLRTLTMQGRLQVDLFLMVKRNYQLPSYKLDEVAKYFLSGKLKSVKREGSVWDLMTSPGNAKVGRSVVLLDEMGDELTEKMLILELGPTFIRVQATDLDMELDTDLAVKWVIGKDDVSPADIRRLHLANSKGRATVAAYCIQDCDLTMDLYNKLETFNNAMCMGNVNSVPVGMIFTRGQGVKIESLIFKACHYAGLTIKTQTSLPFNYEPLEGEVAEQDSYEGAIVLDPVPGFYTKSPIGVCDFASLYPSTIESENISYDSLLWVKDYTMDGVLDKISWTYSEELIEQYEKQGEAMGCRWTDISFDIWKPDPKDLRKNPTKIKTGIRVCRYAQYPGSRKSILPQIVRNLLAARAAKRAEGKKEKDPFRKALLDAEQLAYKLTANSLYGQLGSGVFKVRLQHLAASVTAYGRKQILFAKAAIEHFYGPGAKDPRCEAQIVYGDTDSLFVEINPKNPLTGEPLKGREAIQATIDITEEAGKLITQALKPPHDFEFDKAFSPFIIFSKKRYVGNMYEENADDYVQKSMGIATKRRDYAPIVKTVYGGAIKILLTEKDVPKAADFVRRWVNDLMDDKVSINQLLMTKSLRSEYKAITPPAHKILADRIAARDPGNAPASGDRLTFVYFKTPAGFKGGQGDRVETPAFMKQNGLKPDPEFYIDHQLKNPVSQLFSILIDQLPDAKPPAKGWSSDADVQTAERELYAKDYLFKRALNKHTNTLLKMWNVGSIAEKSPVAQTIKRVTRASAKVSGSAMESLLDRMLSGTVKKEKKKGAK
jgi:DNA polymerase elongation subunit (family B)